VHVRNTNLVKKTVQNDYRDVAKPSSCNALQCPRLLVCECSVADKTLTPDDYEVTSVARECEDADRGNECHVDTDELGATCYSSCTTNYCNDETRRPTWQDLLRRRISQPSAVDDAPARYVSNTANNDTDGPRPPDTGKLLVN